MRNDDRSWRGDTWIRVLSRGQSSARTELARTASWRGMGWVYDFTSHEMRYVCTQAVSAGRLKWVWRLSLWLSENFPEAAGCGARSLGGKGCTSAGVIVQGASVSPLVMWVNGACMGCQDSVGVVRAKTCLSPAPPSSAHPPIHHPPTHPSVHPPTHPTSSFANGLHRFYLQKPSVAPSSGLGRFPWAPSWLLLLHTWAWAGPASISLSLSKYTDVKRQYAFLYLPWPDLWAWTLLLAGPADTGRRGPGPWLAFELCNGNQVA